MVPNLVLYGLLGAALCATLVLFYSLKREIHAQAVEARSGEEAKLDSQVDLKIAAMLERLKEAEAPAPQPVYLMAAPRSGLNLSKRVHALRLLRRGEDVSHIAAALGVPRREVELLIRVNESVKARVASAG